MSNVQISIDFAISGYNFDNFEWIFFKLENNNHLG
jgi:hypothetical protein